MGRARTSARAQNLRAGRAACAKFAMRDLQLGVMRRHEAICCVSAVSATAVARGFRGRPGASSSREPGSCAGGRAEVRAGRRGRAAPREKSHPPHARHAAARDVPPWVAPGATGRRGSTTNRDGRARSLRCCARPAPRATAPGTTPHEDELVPVRRRASRGSRSRLRCDAASSYSRVIACGARPPPGALAHAILDVRARS